MTFSRQDYRKLIRQKRNQLNPDEQSQATITLTRHFLSLSELEQAQHIALYLSADGEVGTSLLIQELQRLGKEFIFQSFILFQLATYYFLAMTRIRPWSLTAITSQSLSLKKKKIIPVEQLDIICTPLVAFDKQGHRLGMGGGYYDRTLEPWFRSQSGPKPIGLAHNCQEVEQLPVESWDVPLPKVLTPKKIWDWE